MGFLGFGKKIKSIDDLSVGVVRDALLDQKVAEQQLIAKRKKADQRYNDLKNEANSQPRTTAELDLYAHKMGRFRRATRKAEADLGDVLSKFKMLDAVADMLEIKEQGERPGFFRDIAKIPPKQFKEGLDRLAKNKEGEKLTIESIEDALGYAVEVHQKVETDPDTNAAMADLNPAIDD